MNAIIFFFFFLAAQLFGYCPSEIDQLTADQEKIICDIVDADDGGA